MPYLLLLAAIAMPAIAWLSNHGVFGPTNAEISARYPTLLVAAGGAFAIWGLIFLLDVALAAWQLGRRQRSDAGLRRVRPYAAAGFALCAVWMIVFSQQWFGAALLIIWLALWCLLQALQQAALDAPPLASSRPLVLAALGLHAGWLSLAVFLNTAQVIVAAAGPPSADRLAWTLLLWALAAALLLSVNRRLGGGIASAAYTAAALWGLGGVVLEQSRASLLPGSKTSAAVAAMLMLVLLAQTAWIGWQRQRRQRSAACAPVDADPWAPYRQHRPRWRP